MSNELSRKVGMYKELLDDGLITEEKYYEIIEHIINKKANEEIELSFAEKRSNLIAKSNKESQELRDRVAGYEEQNRKEYEQKLRDDMTNKEVSFAISFLSQVYNSHGERVYSDEVLNNEEAMPLYKMQSLISKYKENAPEMYKEIIEKIGYEEIVNNTIEQTPEKSEENSSDYKKWVAEERAKDENETVSEVENKPDEQSVENVEEVKTDEVKEGKEFFEEMTTEPKKRKLINIRQAARPLIDKINNSDRKIKNNLGKTLVYLLALIAGTAVALGEEIVTAVTSNIR